MKVIWFCGCLKQLKSREVNLGYLGRVLIKYIQLLINIVELTSLGDDEVERVNINKLKKYHSESVVVDVMVANVYVGRYLNRYHQNKFPTTKPKNSSKLVPKPRKLPWINSIHKIIDDEYFWVDEEKSKSNE